MPKSQKPRVVKFVDRPKSPTRFVDSPRASDEDDEARQKEIELRRHERRERAEANRNLQAVRKR